MTKLCKLNKMANKFHYFGFGSNLLADRIRIQNPTAIRIGAGKLDHYRLDFNTASQTWHGAPATIVPTPDAEVYGAIWEIDNSNLQDLDQQEGVDAGIYVPISVPVLSLRDNSLIDCRAYHLTQQPDCDLRTLLPGTTPPTRQPSKSYLKTIVKGAIETGLPEHYINWLRSVKHNGKMVEKFEKQLNLINVQLATNSEKFQNQ